MLIRNTRRDIARVNTVLAERSRATGGAPGGRDGVRAKRPQRRTKPKRAPKKHDPGTGDLTWPVTKSTSAE